MASPSPAHCLIAESGSTKTEWRYCREGKVVRAFRSQGCNPRIQADEAILHHFQAIFQAELAKEDVGAVYFYGAGLGAVPPRNRIRSVLQQLLPGAQVQVEHDMLAAARSTRRPEGIVCILGTGSNTCHHRQGQVVAYKGGLGYICGDEGSGADLGKHLLKACLQGDMPLSLQQAFEAQLGKPVQDALTELMLAASPNVHMAAWAEFVHAHLHVPAVAQLVEQRMLAFLDATVCRYPGFERLPVDFVGSISHFFAPQLRNACAQRKVFLGSIEKDPIDKLVAYHLQELRKNPFQA